VKCDDQHVQLMGGSGRSDYLQHQAWKAVIEQTRSELVQSTYEANVAQESWKAVCKACVFNYKASLHRLQATYLMRSKVKPQRQHV
jgi:hypothetical protein